MLHSAAAGSQFSHPLAKVRCPRSMLLRALSGRHSLDSAGPPSAFHSLIPSLIPHSITPSLQACASDRNRLCSHVPLGSAAVVHCLQVCSQAGRCVPVPTACFHSQQKGVGQLRAFTGPPKCSWQQALRHHAAAAAAAQAAPAGPAPSYKLLQHSPSWTCVFWVASVWHRSTRPQLNQMQYLPWLPE